MGLFPASFSQQSITPNSFTSIPNTVFFKTSSRAKIFPNPASRVAVKSRIRSRKILRFRESHTVFGSTPGSREYLPDPEFLNRTPRDGSKLERNERFYNYYCSSSITLAISSQSSLCSDPIFSSIIPKFTSYPGSSPKWSETRLARFLNATRM